MLEPFEPFELLEPLKLFELFEPLELLELLEPLELLFFLRAEGPQGFKYQVCLIALAEDESDDIIAANNHPSRETQHMFGSSGCLFCFYQLIDI